jgi:hypothetical protein
MNIQKLIAPVTQNLKSNTKTINMTLLCLVLFMMFPLDRLLRTSVQRDVEGTLRNLVSNPIVCVLMVGVVYAAYLTGDVYMFFLLLFVLHRLMKH